MKNFQELYETFINGNISVAKEEINTYNVKQFKAFMDYLLNDLSLPNIEVKRIMDILIVEDYFN